jgi:hypothetical protein
MSKTWKLHRVPTPMEKKSQIKTIQSAPKGALFNNPHANYC